jgi:hypothetical protein
VKKIRKKSYAVELAVKKFEHELDRKKRRRARRRMGGFQKSHRPFGYARIHPLMNFLRANFSGKNIAAFDKKNSRWIISIPPIFSFIKNPDETLNTIFSLIDISMRDDCSSIFFDHSRLKEMDMGASVVLDIVTLNLRNEWKSHGRNYRFGGQFPEDEKLCQILKSMGITKHLNIKNAEPSEAAKELFICFPLYPGFRPMGSQLDGAQHREKAATQLVTYLNRCLGMASDFEFKDEGKSQILKWAGEIITNAEEHSGHHQWYAIGCMTPLLSQQQNSPEQFVAIGECQLTIFGFGSSIYESLSSPETSQETRNQIANLAATHTTFFNKFEKYSDKDLWTLYALQDGVSRFSPSPGKNTRGKGTVEMIEAFQNFRSEDQACVPEMSLISGSTHIYFNNKYRLKVEDRLDGKRKIIAFNEKNSLEEKPDSEHVHSLAGHFPGTLLTFKFFIDSRYLNKIFGKKEETNARND